MASADRGKGGISLGKSNTILYSRKWAQMKRFYGEVLGLAPAFVKEDWFIEFRLGEEAHLSIADAARCSVEPNGGRGLTLSFHVADLPGARRHLEEEGVAATPIETHSWRFPYFYVHDPEGNRIEFWSGGGGE